MAERKVRLGVHLSGGQHRRGTAGHLGIAPDRAVNYHCDSESTRLNYEVVGQAVAAVRCSAPLDEHWKNAIEEDFRKRQKKGRQ